MAHIPIEETFKEELEEIPVNDQEKPESTIIKRPPEPRKITPAEIDRFFLSLNGNVFTTKDIQTALGADSPSQKSSIYGRISVLLEKGAIRKLGPIPGSRVIQYEVVMAPSIPVEIQAPSPKTKVCRDCQNPLPINQFQHNNRSKDGHLHICMQCHKDRTHIPTPDRANSLLKIPIDDYQWIISRLKVAGKLTKNLRTWPQQALVYILQGLERDGITGEE